MKVDPLVEVGVTQQRKKKQIIHLNSETCCSFLQTPLCWIPLILTTTNMDWLSRRSWKWMDICLCWPWSCSINLLCRVSSWWDLSPVINSANNAITGMNCSGILQLSLFSYVLIVPTVSQGHDSLQVFALWNIVDQLLTMFQNSASSAMECLAEINNAGQFLNVVMLLVWIVWLLIMICQRCQKEDQLPVQHVGEMSMNFR